MSKDVDWEGLHHALHKADIEWTSNKTFRVWSLQISPYLDDKRQANITNQEYEIRPISSHCKYEDYPTEEQTKQ